MSEIDTKYQQLGGEKGFLGKPSGPEQTCADGVGRFRVYQRGRIYFHPNTGAHEVHDLIHEKWLTLGAEQSVLGYPTSDETGVDGAADTLQRFNDFERGAVYWTNRTGAHELHGAILAKWRGLSAGDRARMGFPVTDQRIAHDGEGRYNDFEGGSIYWTRPLGAHTIYDVIRSKWLAIGGTRSVLGYPTADESGGLGPLGLGARFNLFERGSIYRRNWTAHFVHGDIDEQWAAQGREQGPLGFPTSDEFPSVRGNLRFNNFEHGTLTRVPESRPQAEPQEATEIVTAFDLRFGAAPDVAKAHDTHAKNGFRLLSLSMYGAANDPRYAAVWVKAKDAEQKVIFKAGDADLQKFVGQLIDDRFLPVMICATGLADKASFALVCEKRTSGPVPVLRHKLVAGPEENVYDRDTFAFWCQWARANHHVLRWAAVYGDAANPRYAGIWELDRAGTPWNVAYHDAQLAVPVNHMPERKPALFGKDELDDVAAAQSFWARTSFLTRDGHRRLAVFREDRAGKTETRLNLTAAQVGSEGTKLQLMPVCVQGARVNGESRFDVVYAQHVRPRPRKLTITGQKVDTLVALDDAVATMLRHSGTRNASLAVARDGRLVYARAFTHAESDVKPITPAHTFRIASISKSMTALAVYQLIRDGLLAPAPTEPVEQQKLLDEPLVEHLNVTVPANADPRFKQVTLRQMISHRSGLRRGIADSITDAQKVLDFFQGKKKLPLTMADVGTYSASLPLDFDPGTKTAYSNLAFLFLGWLVEQKRGSYVDAVRQHIFDPIGIPQRPKITGSQTTDQGPLEVIAYDRELRVGRSVMNGNGTIAPHEYGTLNFDVSKSAGAWSLAAADYVRFLSRLFDGSNTLLDAAFLDDLTTAERSEMQKHGGGLAGAETFAELFDQHGSRFAYAIFYNNDVPGDFVAHIRDVITALPNTAWPAAPFDLFPTVDIT